MIHKICYIIALLVFFCQAQKKTISIALERACEILETIDLENAGFIIKTGRKTAPYSTKLEWALHYYKNNLDSVYSIPLEKQQMDKGLYNPLVASPNGNYVYHGEKITKTDADPGKLRFTQIKTNLETKVFEIDLKAYPPIDYLFCDNENFYMLSAKQNSNKKNLDTDNKDKQLFLISHNRDNFKRQDLFLPVPEINQEQGYKQSFWEFTNQDENFIYVHRKDINLDTGQHKYHFLTVSKSEGICSHLMVLDLDIKHIRPSNNISVPAGIAIGHSNNKDFIKVKKGSRTEVQHEASAYGDLIFDTKTKTIYIYGLYGSDTFKSKDSKYSGYFLNAFNLEGEQVFFTKKEFPKELAKNERIKGRNTPYSRKVDLKVYEDHFEFELISNGSHFKLYLSQLGEFEKAVEMVKEKQNRNKKAFAHDSIKKAIENASVDTFFNKPTTDNPLEKGGFSIFKQDCDFSILTETKKGGVNFYYFEEE